MRPIVFFILLIANIPLYRRIGRAIFRDARDVSESVRYSFTPDFISLLRGEFKKDFVGEAKIGLFIIACVILVTLEYWFVVAVFGL